MSKLSLSGSLYYIRKDVLSYYAAHIFLRIGQTLVTLG